MRLVIGLDARFCRTPDDSVWSPGMYNYGAWARYLKVFDEVRVLGRVVKTLTVPPGHERADGIGVSFAPIPSFSGPWGYVRNAWGVNQCIRQEVRHDDAILLRMSPSQIATALGYLALKAHRPYAVEVIGDPATVFASGALRHPMSPLFRWLLPRQLAQLCAGASAVGYVTREALQREYPPAPDAFSTHYSSITLADEAFAPAPHTLAPGQARWRLVFVGTLSQLYKGQEVLLRAMASCVRQHGYDIQLTMVGDGRYRESLEALAARLGIATRVEFTGQLASGPAVREQLARADLFVLPSRTEGLPRVILEAMAMGRCCIATTVGGVPELLPPDVLVPPGNAPALSSRIRELLSDPRRIDQAASRNIERAREYHESVLAPRRTALYQHLRSATTEWLSRQAH